MNKKFDNKQFLEDFNIDDMVPSNTGSINNGFLQSTSIEVPQQSNETDIGEESMEITSVIETAETVDPVVSKSSKKTMTSKQRKTSLLEYQQSFLIVPKITDRKTVFISNKLREVIVGIVRKLGTEKSSVSGFIENLVRNHLSEYKDDIESWKKL